MENKFQNYTLLLDMDEVLADFAGGALRVHGVSREDLEPHWPAGHWSIVEPLASYFDDPDFDDDKFWQPIHDRGWQFWANLEPLPWFSDLVEFVQRVFPLRWYVVTSPSHSPESYEGKLRWLRSRFGGRFDSWVPTRRKQLLAGPGKLLVDDRESTCERFAAECRRLGTSQGQDDVGNAIVFPSRHNSIGEVSDPVAYLERLICT